MSDGSRTTSPSIYTAAIRQARSSGFPQPWAERGISAAFYDVIAAESLAGMYGGEIAPAQSSRPAPQLCDEVIYVMAGRGSATRKGPISFEWGPRSLFAIPLNHRYQLHNSSGREPARFVSVNTIPIVYNLFRDPKFVFGCDWQFDRIDGDASLSDSVVYRPDEKHERTAVTCHETTFVPDIFLVQRTSFAERGAGNQTVYFELANSVISVHVAEHPGLQFFNPHRHGRRWSAARSSAPIFGANGRLQSPVGCARARSFCSSR